MVLYLCGYIIMPLIASLVNIFMEGHPRELTHIFQQPSLAMHIRGTRGKWVKMCHEHVVVQIEMFHRYVVSQLEYDMVPSFVKYVVWQINMWHGSVICQIEMAHGLVVCQIKIYQGCIVTDWPTVLRNHELSVVYSHTWPNIAESVSMPLLTHCAENLRAVCG